MLELITYCYREFRNLPPSRRQWATGVMAFWAIWISVSCYGIRQAAPLPPPVAHPVAVPVSADVVAAVVVASAAPPRALTPSPPISITRAPARAVVQEPPPEGPTVGSQPEPAAPKTAPRATIAKRPHRAKQARVMMAQDASGHRIIVERHENFVVERPAAAGR